MSLLTIFIMRVLIIALVVSSFLVSCTLIPESPVVVTPVDTGSTISGTTDHKPSLVEDLSGKNGEYYPIFEWISSKKIHIMHTSRQSTKISFINSEAKAIDVKIDLPTLSAGNLRWSQVIMPDGTMDGPFGQNTSYNLRQRGWHTLIFNENQMTGDPWSGEADIILTLHRESYPADVVVR